MKLIIIPRFLNSLLEDSAQVLSKLTFHRESSKAFGSKLPRVLPGQTYTYGKYMNFLKMPFKTYYNSGFLYFCRMSA